MPPEKRKSAYMRATREAQTQAVPVPETPTLPSDRDTFEQEAANISPLSQKAQQHISPATPATKALKSKRDRRSLYMDDGTLAKLNDAYKQMNHDIFPQEVKKVSFLSAIVTVALSHGDELLDLLLPHQRQ